MKSNSKLFIKVILLFYSLFEYKIFFEINESHGYSFPIAKQTHPKGASFVIIYY